MSDKNQAQELGRIIEKYIRPITFPVAVKFQEKKVQPPLKFKRPLKDLGHPIALCQGVALARRIGWTVIFGKEDHACPVGSIVLGHNSPKKLLEGTIAYPYYAESVEVGKIMEKNYTFLPADSVKELWLSPLGRAEFEPDVILIYGNPAQIARLAQGANYSTGTGVDSKTFAKGACSSYMARTFLKEECSLIVTSGGERVFAGVMDDELVFAIPSRLFEQVGKGIEAVHKEGLSRIPTPFYSMRIEPVFPPEYYQIIDD